MLILIAHGSRDADWRASVERLIDALPSDLRRDDVRLAYMQFAPPTLMDVATEAVSSGADKISVLPLFLTSEGHVARDIRRLIEEVREAYKEVELELLPPVGEHRLFVELLSKIIAEVEG